MWRMASSQAAAALGTRELQIVRLLCDPHERRRPVARLLDALMARLTGVGLGPRLGPFGSHLSPTAPHPRGRHKSVGMLVPALTEWVMNPAADMGRNLSPLVPPPDMTSPDKALGEAAIGGRTSFVVAPRTPLSLPVGAAPRGLRLERNGVPSQTFLWRST
jgi:hypothetical protein